MIHFHPSTKAAAGKLLLLLMLPLLFLTGCDPGTKLQPASGPSLSLTDKRLVLSTPGAAAMEVDFGQVAVASLSWSSAWTLKPTVEKMNKELWSSGDAIVFPPGAVFGLRPDGILYAQMKEGADSMLYDFRGVTNMLVSFNDAGGLSLLRTCSNPVDIMALMKAQASNTLVIRSELNPKDTTFRILAVTGSGTLILEDNITPPTLAAFSGHTYPELLGGPGWFTRLHFPGTTMRDIHPDALRSPPPSPSAAQKSHAADSKADVEMTQCKFPLAGLQMVECSGCLYIGTEASANLCRYPLRECSVDLELNGDVLYIVFMGPCAEEARRCCALAG